jgi:hypothetical protein
MVKMDSLDIKQIKDKLTTYKEYNTYIFIKTKTLFYNGYILSVHDDSFMFMDDVLPNPFPIRFDELINMPSPSMKKGKDFNYGRR